MRRHVFSFVVLSLLVSTFVSAQAQSQTPDAAINHFNKALKLTERGEIDRAIEEYSQAIAISSRLDTRKKSAPLSPLHSFSGTVEVLDKSNEDI